MAFPLGITLPRSNYSSPPQSRAEEKDPLVVDPLEIIVLDGPEKYIYICQHPVIQGRKRTVTMRIIGKRRFIHLESLGHDRD